MHRYFSASAILLASGMMLPGSAQAQQSPAATAQQSTSTKSQSSSGTTTQRATARGQSTLTLTTQKSKASYAIGMQIGASLKRQAVDVDPAILERGIKDALAGAHPLLTDDQVKATLADVQKQVMQQQQAKLAAQAATNKKDGDAFLAANKAKPDVVTLPSGLQYKILQKGAGPKPALSDIVVCNYRGSSIDGKEFSSSKPDQPLITPVSRLFKGLSEALQLMPVGSKWEIYVPPGLALGDHPLPDIGPEATLVFDMELVSIKPPNPAGNPFIKPGPAPQATPPSNSQPPAAANPPAKPPSNP
jgi:FKBP-type peptidyl-prolyl cis-trans isomerase FklB